MVRKTGPTNILQRRLTDDLYKNYREQGSAVWRAAADFLSRPRRSRVEVNLSQVSRVSNQKATVLVPGKVLGTGRIDRAVQIAALDFTESAKNKIQSSGGECLTIGQLLEKNPTGKNVRIIR